MQFIRSLGVVFVLCSCLSAQDWPRFRGPNGSGVSASAKIPSQLDVQKNLLWKIEAGNGASSPIIFRDKLFLTSHSGEDRFIRCFDPSDGKEIWSYSIKQNRKEMATAPCGPATPTPVATEAGVIAHFPDAGLVACTLDGDFLWRKDLGPFEAFHGVASSLVASGEIVIVQIDQLQNSFVVALSMKTGEEVWRKERIDGTTAAYSTPSVLQRANSSEFVLSGPIEVVGYDVQTGKRKWWLAGATNAPISIPLIENNRVFVCEPYYAKVPFDPKEFLAFDKNKNGKVEVREFEGQPTYLRLAQGMDRKGNSDGIISEDEVLKAFESFTNSGGLMSFEVENDGELKKESALWVYQKEVPQISSPILHQGILYVINDGGILLAFDAENGDLLRKGRLKNGGRKYEASSVIAGDKMVLSDTDGKVHIVQLESRESFDSSKKWTILSVNDLSESLHATPAISNNRIFIRTKSTLYCFGVES